MVEAHYGHLAPSFIADEIRKGAPQFGFNPPDHQRRSGVMSGRKRPARPVIASAIGTARGVTTASAVGTITALPPDSRLELTLVRGRGRPPGTKSARQSTTIAPRWR